MREPSSARANTYPQTSWTLIDQAVDDPSGDGLARFRELYERPVAAYLRNKLSTSSVDADEATQLFFSEKIWRGNVLSNAEPGHTRFRNYLKRCVNRFAIDLVRREQRAPRSVELHDHHAGSYAPDVSFDFEVEWARALVGRAVARAREQCEEKNQMGHFEIFSERHLSDADEPPEFAEIAKGRLDKEGKPLDTRTARGYSDTVARRIRKALMTELAEDTGSEAGAEQEALILVSVLRSAS